jgi:hypothetical protein
MLKRTRNLLLADDWLVDQTLAEDKTLVGPLEALLNNGSVNTGSTTCDQSQHVQVTV